jgi:hypothetical protein
MTETKYWAQLDWHCEHAGLTRVFEDGAVYGDPYVYALPFVVRERFDEPEESGRLGFVEYVGVIAPMTPSISRAIYNATVAAGWGILSTRIKDGKQRTVEVTRIYWDHKEYEALRG